MKNTLTNRYKLALQKGNTIDLVAEGLVTIVSNSDSVPTTVNFAYITPNWKIVADIEFGQDADTVALTIPFDYRVLGGEVTAKATTANAGVIIKSDANEMCSEIAMLANETVTAIANVSPSEAIVIYGTDILTIVGVSSGADGIVALDIIPY